MYTVFTIIKSEAVWSLSVRNKNKCYVIIHITSIQWASNHCDRIIEQVSWIQELKQMTHTDFVNWISWFIEKNDSFS